MQLFKRFQRTILAAELWQQIIQLRADFCRKLGCGFVGGQLPTFADRLDCGIVRILGHMVEQLRIEFLRLSRKPVNVSTLREQRVKRLKNISGQCRKAVHLRRGLLLDSFQILIILAQIAVNAVFQLGALQHTIRFLCRGRSGILKIAPAGIQYALYGTKISFQSKPSYKDSKRERSISTAFPRSCFSRRI